VNWNTAANTAANIAAGTSVWAVSHSSIPPLFYTYLLYFNDIRWYHVVEYYIFAFPIRVRTKMTCNTSWFDCNNPPCTILTTFQWHSWPRAATTTLSARFNVSTDCVAGIKILYVAFFFSHSLVGCFLPWGVALTISGHLVLIDAHQAPQGRICWLLESGLAATGEVISNQGRHELFRCELKTVRLLCNQGSAVMNLECDWEQQVKFGRQEVWFGKTIEVARLSQLLLSVRNTSFPMWSLQVHKVTGSSISQFSMQSI